MAPDRGYRSTSTAIELPACVSDIQGLPHWADFTSATELLTYTLKAIPHFNLQQHLPIHTIIHLTAFIMSRQPDYSRDYYSRPSSSSRNWSEEAVRGSWESSYQRSTVASPQDRTSSWRGATTPDYSARAGMVDNWLGTQRTHDPSRPMYSVPEFVTPDSSPVISDSSATFQTRPNFGHSPAISDGSATFQSRPVYASRQADRTPVVPPDYYTSSPSRTTWRPSPGQGSSSRGATSHSTHNSVDYDLRGVGSFADGDRSRRSKDVKYKPLSNWFDLWLP